MIRKVSDIVNLLSRFISERTINAKIKDLDKYKLIVNNNSNLLLKKINSKYNQTLFFPMSILILFLKKKISAPQLKVYLALKSLLQMKSNVTLDTLSEYLKLTPSTISEHLNNLKRKGIIDINTVVNDKGLLCNHYSFNNISI